MGGVGGKKFYDNGKLQNVFCSCLLNPLNLRENNLQKSHKVQAGQRERRLAEINRNVLNSGVLNQPVRSTVSKQRPHICRLRGSR